jgi:flagellin-like hook-associated protein FlgL
MNLQTQQVAYQAALGALSKVLGPSLLDFIPRG